MAKQNSQQVLIDLQAEAKANGVNEVASMTEAVISLGGAFGVTAEQAAFFQAQLETIQNSKGSAAFGDIARQLNASAVNFERIFKATSGNKRVGSKTKALYQANTDQLLASVGQVKRSHGLPNTKEESIALQRFEQNIQNLNPLIEQVNQAFTDIIADLKKNGEASLETMVALGQATEFFRRFANQDSINRSRDAKTAGQERRNKQEEEILSRIAAQGNEDAYLDLKAKKRIHDLELAEAKYDTYMRKHLRNQYYGTNLGEGIRHGLLNNEEMLLRSGGVRGFAARLGGTIFKNKAFGDMFNGGVAGAGVNMGAFLGAGTVTAISALGKSIYDLSKASIDAYENIEKVKTQLGVVYGTQGEADSMFGKISQYAIKSPFGVKDVAEQATILKQSGVADYELMPVLKSLGDLAGGNTEKMNRLANAVSQIAASGTATARQMRMFTMAGVPIYKAIADVKGIQRNDVRSQIQKGNVTYEDIIKALDKLTQEGGPFYKAVEKGAKTLAARKQNLADIRELALAEGAAANNLGFSPADFAKGWTSFKEDWWKFWYDNRRSAKIEKQVEAANQVESQIDALDTLKNDITSSGQSGEKSLQELNYIRVMKMEVENLSGLDREHREAIYSESYKQKVLEAEELGTNLNLALYAAKHLTLENADATEQLIKSLGFGGAIGVFNHLAGNGVSGARTLNTDPESLMYEIQRQYNKKNKKIGNVRSSTGLGGENRRYTKEERGYFGVSSRETLTMASGIPLGGGKNVGEKALDYVKQIYENSKEAEYERIALEEEAKKTVKDTYNEIKEQGLKENKFGFIDKSETLSKNLSLMQRYMGKLDDKLDFDNPLTKEDSIKELNANIDSLGDILVQGILYNDVKTGRGSQRSETAKAYLRQMRNPTSDIERNEAITYFGQLAANLPEELKTFAEAIISRLGILDIDEKYLDFNNKGKADKFAFDKAYSPLIRELIERDLGVSLYRTMGSDMAINRKDRNINGGIGTFMQVLSYAQNNRERELAAAVSNALLSQTGRNKVSWFDISSRIAQDTENYKRRGPNGGAAYSYYRTTPDGRRQFIEGENIGRYRKAFVNFPRTREQIEAYGLSGFGTAGTAKAIADTYKQQLEKINTFFTESFTSTETKETSTRLLELAREIENLKGYKPSLTETKAYEDKMAALQKEYDELMETSIKAQLGTLEDPKYRESITALAHWIEEASDGTMEFSEVILEANRIKQQEISELYAVTDTLATFKSTIEDLDNKIKDSQIESLLYTLPKGNSASKENQRQSMKYVLDYAFKNESDLLYQAFPGMSNKEIGTSLINSVFSPTATRGLSLQQYKSNVESYQKDLDAYRQKYTEFMQNENLKRTKEITNTQTYKNYLAELKKKPGHKNDYLVGLNWKEGDFDDRGRLDQFRRDLFTELYGAAPEGPNEYSAAEAIISELIDIKEKFDEVIANQKAAEYAKASDKLESDAYKFRNMTGGSLLAPDTFLFGGNTGHQQKLIGELGLDEETSYRDYVATLFTNSSTRYNGSSLEQGYSLKDSSILEKLKADREKAGLNNDILADIKPGEFITEAQLNNLVKAKEELDGINALERKVGQTTRELAKTMKSAFDSTIVDGISQSMVTLGECMREGVDASEEIGKGLQNMFSSLLKNIGPQMTSAGLAIVTAAAQENGSDKWGKIAGGLALAAAGGFLSWSGGLMSGKDDKDDDKDAQREARLKSLADILSDLIAQAKTDAEYYERNVRHRQALSEDYSLSSRSVNDMIITPEGTFSTHPEDTIIAMKHPEELGSKNSSPNVTITIVNQSGDTVKVASTEKREDANGDIDIKATIVAVTADAVASGELDGAFAQMQARQRGVSRTY